MRTLVIAAADLKDGEYIGTENLAEFDGNVEVEGSLGTVRFRGALSVRGYIWAKAGSSIDAGEEIKAGEGAPVIHDTGAPAALSVGDRVDTDAVLLAQALLSFVPEQLSLTIMRFEYTPEHGLSLVTDAAYRVVMGDSQNVEYKMAVWKTVEEDIGRGAMAGHVLDLRFRDHPSFQ